MIEMFKIFYENLLNAKESCKNSLKKTLQYENETDIRKENLRKCFSRQSQTRILSSLKF